MLHLRKRLVKLSSSSHTAHYTLATIFDGMKCLLFSRLFFLALPQNNSPVLMPEFHTLLPVGGNTIRMVAIYLCIATDASVGFHGL